MLIAQYFAIIALAFLAVQLVTPVVIALAYRVGGVDLPGGRKTHAGVIPRIGGVAIVVATTFSLAPGLLVPNVLPAIARNLGFLAVLLWGGGMAFLLGLYDDLKGTNAKWKFAVQIVAALIAYSFRFRFDAIGLPFVGIVHLPQYLSLPITILWIVGVVNAINLIDGLDGLAAGLALIICATVGSIGFFRGDVLSTLLCCALAGALAGFLRHNWNPARIFMGDSGSMFIGFVLALLALRSSVKGPTAVAIVLPILALGVPVIDTLFVMWLRFWQAGNSGLTERIARMFRADRNHLHHLLLERLRGHHRGAVAVIYALATLFAAGAFWVAHSNNSTQGFLLLVCGLVGVAFVRWAASRDRFRVNGRQEDEESESAEIRRAPLSPSGRMAAGQDGGRTR
jgi:UDP-GlcNAc:undecaprenyl-phosphate GlcNAc-1-phosphate transferase